MVVKVSLRRWQSLSPMERLDAADIKKSLQKSNFKSLGRRTVHDLVPARTDEKSRWLCPSATSGSDSEKRACSPCSRESSAVVASGAESVARAMCCWNLAQSSSS